MASASSRMTSLKPFLKKGKKKGGAFGPGCWVGAGEGGAGDAYSQPDPHECSQGALLSPPDQHLYHSSLPPSSSPLAGHPPTPSHPPWHASHPRSPPKPTSQAKRRGRLCRRGSDKGMGSFGKRRPATYLKMVLVLAKLRMGPRTMSIPRSSEALSWREMAWIRIPFRGCT